MTFFEKIFPNSIELIHRNRRGVISNLFMGAGLCYAMDQKKFSHIPLVLMFPSAYTGYHIYQNTKNITVKDIKKHI